MLYETLIILFHIYSGCYDASSRLSALVAAIIIKLILQLNRDCKLVILSGFQGK